MENYTKYRPKGREELQKVLADADRLFVIACSKCFKEFDVAEEPERGEFLRLAEELGKTVTGSAQLDFLCNGVQTEKKLAGLIPPETETVAVLSCGLGVQTAAALTGKPCIAVCDTRAVRGQHGMALTDKACAACAQCYLSGTGGICPIVDCAKSLLNGPCGGAKNGKCEVDPDRDCAWERIFRRLEKQGRLGEFASRPVELRDWSRADHKKIAEYVRSIREARLDGYFGGVHPAERKHLSENAPLLRFPEPEIAVIPLSQHIGKPAEPAVKPGDCVKVGQVIGTAAGAVSSPVHASVSGTVLAVEPRRHPNGGTSPAVVIRSDGKNELHESVKPRGDLDTLSPAEIVEIIRDSGIVGMGGAAFPTAVKLTPNKPVDTVLLNGCECEPLLTADQKVMEEYPVEILYGLRALCKAVGASRGIVAVEDNKPDAITALREKAAGLENVEIVPVRTKYPQGAEKMLIKRVLGRQVPSGGLPADVGAVVCNVSTAKAVADAILRGMPLTERVVTVTGERIQTPGNYLVKIGTPLRALVEYSGGLTGADAVIKTGGPMMGIPQPDLDVPVVKGTNGVTACDREISRETPCIRCGRCVDVCPMELSPLHFAKYAAEDNWQGMKEQRVTDCIECRSCEFICSARIPLLSRIKAGKAAVRGMK